MNEITAIRQAEATACSPEEARDLILAKIDAVGPELEKYDPVGDQLGHIPSEVVKLIRSTGVLSMKLPKEVGGLQLGGDLQTDVFERIGYYNASAGWCTFIWTDGIGLASALLPDETVNQVVNGYDVPTLGGGGGMSFGKLTLQDGGARITGRWKYGSGFHGANYLMVPAKLEDVQGPQGMFFCVIPAESLEYLGNWNVLGLKGTGSGDFSAEDVFVPTGMMWPLMQKPKRGGTYYSLSIVGFAGNSLPATAMGIARRALDDAVSIARTKARGYVDKKILAERESFQMFVGRADMTLRAAGLLVRASAKAITDAAALGLPVTMEMENASRAAGSFAVEEAKQVVLTTVKYFGGDAIREGGRLERAVRNILTASTHYSVGETALVERGKTLLGLEMANVMA